mgnify:CR=1 FL=1
MVRPWRPIPAEAGESVSAVVDPPDDGVPDRGDDALDVVGVHGVGGILGSLLVGVFAQQMIGGVDGLIAGNAHQLLIQLIAVLVVGAYSALVTFVLLKVINRISPLRASETLEEAGLDTEFQEEA